jgi:2-succinyl-5-enolpyruvyl-6-hydroxy-3-cyclohexene-1-carboxylate synthase
LYIGSALLNYYPAFAEAFYSQIPMIVISADRPQSKLILDGQTIRQENVFENHSLYNAYADVSAENDLKINEAINTAISQKVLFILMLLLKNLCTRPFRNFQSK